MATFAERFIRCKERKDVSLQQISLDTGITKGALSNYKNGHKKNPPIEQNRQLNLKDYIKVWSKVWSRQKKIDLN